MRWRWSNWRLHFIIIIAELSAVILAGSYHRLPKILSRSMASLRLETWSTSKDGVFAIPIEPLIQPMSITLTVFVTLVHGLKRFPFFVVFGLQFFKLGVVSLELEQVWRTLEHEIEFFFAIEFGWEHLSCFVEGDHS